MKKILALLCMLSKKNEKYLREIIKNLIQKFQHSKEIVSQDRMNSIIKVFCQSLNPEKVFIEFAYILNQVSDIHFV